MEIRLAYRFSSNNFYLAIEQGLLEVQMNVDVFAILIDVLAIYFLKRAPGRTPDIDQTTVDPHPGLTSS